MMNIKKRNTIIYCKLRAKSMILDLKPPVNQIHPSLDDVKLSHCLHNQIIKSFSLCAHVCFDS